MKIAIDAGMAVKTHKQTKIKSLFTESDQSKNLTFSPCRVSRWVTAFACYGGLSAGLSRGDTHIRPARLEIGDAVQACSHTPEMRKVRESLTVKQR